MTNNPTISIVTVVYNGASTLEQTILSVINQTYKNIEYIIIDGGSTDGTIDIIKRYEDKLACWISEPDKGIYDAMNKGIDKATGEWIAMLNSDDYYIDCNVISTIAMRLEQQSNIDILYGNIRVEKNGKIKDIKSEYPQNLRKRMCIQHPTCFVKKQVYMSRKYNIKYKKAADYDFLLWCLEKQYLFLYYNYTSVFFSLKGISNTAVFHLDAFHIWKEYFGIFIAIYRYLRDLIPKLKRIPMNFIG